jgi:hypothetical protein
MRRPFIIAYQPFIPVYTAILTRAFSGVHPPQPGPVSRRPTKRGAESGFIILRRHAYLVLYDHTTGTAEVFNPMGGTSPPTRVALDTLLARLGWSTVHTADGCPSVVFPQAVQIASTPVTRACLYAGYKYLDSQFLWVNSLCIFVCLYVHTVRSRHKETLCEAACRIEAGGERSATAIVRFADTLSRAAAGLVAVDTLHPPASLPVPCGDVEQPSVCTVVGDVGAVSSEEVATLRECVEEVRSR